MPAIDAQIRQYQDEIEDRTAFINGVVAAKSGGDLDASEMRLVEDATTRIRRLNDMIAPLQESNRVAIESRSRFAELQMQTSRPAPRPVEYRSAGAYIVDQWQAGLGIEEARERLGLYLRAAAHQTTADNAG